MKEEGRMIQSAGSTSRPVYVERIFGPDKHRQRRGGAIYAVGAGEE